LSPLGKLAAFQRKLGCGLYLGERKSIPLLGLLKCIPNWFSRSSLRFGQSQKGIAEKRLGGSFKTFGWIYYRSTTLATESNKTLKVKLNVY
jgi:hypothetical protein